MTFFSSLWKLICATGQLLSGLMFLLVRHAKRADDPVIQTETEREKFQDAVAKSDENTVNTILAADLERLRDTTKGKADSR